MPRRSLETVLVLRQRAVDEARRNLAVAVAAANAADAEAHAAELLIAAEAQRAAEIDGTDELVEAFAVWLPGARRHAKEARAAEERLAAEVGCCRAELTATRVGLEVIEALLRQEQERADEVDTRVAQATLDEAGARAHAPEM